MINKTEFVTEIYVDNDNDAMVAEFAFTEKASVDTAIASFNAMGFDASTISKIETYQIPQHYTANELA
jgi:hypothetical protein|tara:strand:+ start:270 stop:473 length:204 start_codon:yes stop_codon:yes gene_type:complete